MHQIATQSNWSEIFRQHTVSMEDSPWLKFPVNFQHITVDFNSTAAWESCSLQALLAKLGCQDLWGRLRI